MTGVSSLASVALQTTWFRPTLIVHRVLDQLYELLHASKHSHAELASTRYSAAVGGDDAGAFCAEGSAAC